MVGQLAGVDPHRAAVLHLGTELLEELLEGADVAQQRNVVQLVVPRSE